MDKLLKRSQFTSHNDPDMPGFQNSQRLTDFVLKYNTILIFIILMVVSSFISDAFFTSRNITNLLRQVSGIGIVSLGMLLVILTGGIDLSVGSIVAFSGVLSAYFLLSISCLPGIRVSVKNKSGRLRRLVAKA